MTKIKTLNLPTYLYNTILSFITNRSFQVRKETGTSQIHKIKAGVPQGSVLGSTLLLVSIGMFYQRHKSLPIGNVADGKGI